MSYVQYTTNVDGHTYNDDQYDANANYDDVFDTKHVVQAIEDIHIATNPTYNNNYKLYYDDEYHDFNQISQKCVDNERVSTHTHTQHTLFANVSIAFSAINAKTTMPHTKPFVFKFRSNHCLKKKIFIDIFTEMQCRTIIYMLYRNIIFEVIFRRKFKSNA